MYMVDSCKTSFKFYNFLFLLALVLKGLFRAKFFICSPSHCLKTYMTDLLWNTIGNTLFHAIKTTWQFRISKNKTTKKQSIDKVG